MTDTDVLRRRLADAERAGLRGEAESLLNRVQDVDGVKLVAAPTSAHNVEAMREMGDYLKQKLDSVAIALGAVVDGAPMIVTMVTPDLVSRGLPRRQHRAGRRQADGRRRRRAARNGPGRRPPAGASGRGPGQRSRPGTGCAKLTVRQLVTPPTRREEDTLLWK